ncbi:MAG: cell division protein FtsL [Lachnospiraceae bacterium]|jgi:cell division protein FtsL|nr:cell division protein FtsL [Lachnospiraceae bacterium]
MTAKRKLTGRRSGEDYERRHLYVIEGNTARELAPRELPTPEEQWEEQVRRRPKTRERVMPMSPTFVMLLAFASALMLAVCVYYLQVRVSIYGRTGNIQTMEQELKELKDANEAARSRIEAASDIKQIYKTATEELGMVYPEDSQIIRYDRTESEYVQQYEKIPEE